MRTGGEPPAATHLVRVVRRDEPAPLTGPATLTLEDGTELSVERELPPDLPLGYHDLRSHGADADARDAAHHQPRSLPPPRRLRDVGRGGAAVRRPLDAQLGHG